MNNSTCFWETLPCECKMGKIMDVSTKHITRNDDALLKKDCDARPSVAIVFRKDDVGYFVHVPHDDIEEYEREFRDVGYSEEFIELIRIARAEGAMLLCISADSGTSGKLSSFDW